MNEPIVVCPKCKTEIRLTESLAAPLVEAARKKFEKEASEKETEISRRETAVLADMEKIAASQNALEETIQTRVKLAREGIVSEEAKKARQLFEADLVSRDRTISDLNETIKLINTKLTTAQSAELDLRKTERALNERLREMDLQVEKRVSASVAAIELKARERADEESRLKLAEKDKMISDIQRQMSDLKRKLEQGSQQLQGEVQELDIESCLSSHFPSDVFQPVPKGEHGGDTIHRVVNLQGHTSATILWESKRTKNWSDAWLSKTRADQRCSSADAAVIISQALPKEVESFGYIDGVWVASPKFTIPVAILLRQSLLDLSAARKLREGQKTKMELVYQYLSGQKFRQRVEAIVEQFTEMKDDLDRERRTMTRLWAKREEQLRCVLDATAGMYGDLQGIAGKSLQEIDGLSLTALPKPSSRR